MKDGFNKGLATGGIISIFIVCLCLLLGCYTCACDMVGCSECAPSDFSIITIGCIIIVVVILIVSSLIGMLYGKIYDDQDKRANGLETSGERKKRLKREKKAASEQKKEEEFRRKVVLFDQAVWKRYNYIKNTPFKKVTSPVLKYSNDDISTSILVNQEKFTNQVVGTEKAAYIMIKKEKALYDDIVKNLKISVETIKKYL